MGMTKYKAATSWNNLARDMEESHNFNDNLLKRQAMREEICWNLAKTCGKYTRRVK